MDAFVMSSRDQAQSQREREARTLAMLAEADYADYLADMADTLFEEMEMEGESSDSPACLECRDSGTRRFSTGFGLCDWIEEACPFCRGTALAVVVAFPAAVRKAA